MNTVKSSKSLYGNKWWEWEREFPNQFFDALYRLYNLPNKKTGKHPQFFGHLIRKYIFHPMAESKGAVLELLDEKILLSMRRVADATRCISS